MSDDGDGEFAVEDEAGNRAHITFSDRGALIEAIQRLEPKAD